MSPRTPETLAPIAFTASSSSFWRRPVMKTWAPSLTKSCAVANPIPSVPPVMTAVLPSSFLVIVFSVIAQLSRTFRARMFPPRSNTRLLESEHRLAEVIGQMVRAAQQDGEAIARRIFGEIFFRYGSVPLDPVGQRHFFKSLPQVSIDDVPCLANLFVRRNGGL